MTLTSRLMTDSMKSASWGKTVAEILAAGLLAVDPARAINKHVQRSANMLRVDQLTYDLDQYEHIYMVGAGKAGVPMAVATATLLGPYLSEAIVIVKEGHADIPSLPHPAGDNEIDQTNLPYAKKIKIVEAGHPLPDERGRQGTQQIIRLLSKTGPDDLVIILISGGGSALLLSPPGEISLDELQHLTSVLLACGASINEINCLRKHLDEIKGGGLARLAAPASVIALILSDVVGDPLDVIASGPTVADSTSFRHSYEILKQYYLFERVSGAIVKRINRGVNGEYEENPQVGDPIFDKVQNVIIGSNRLAAEASIRKAQQEGLQTMLLTTWLQGEAQYAGRFLGAIARQISATQEPIQRPACIVAGGETTVTLKGGGLGGRNQELALGAVLEISDLREVALITLATDGGDGPTDAAGAVVTGDTMRRAQQLGLTPVDFLARNDSYHFFEPLGDLLKPGPTQTNVNDLAFLFAW